ncbi:hypothetical protein OIU84_006384 [Salix udensis]|uniref:J domain-containing protein n=1 Tax=Salix udensis TaxID=889485 RepID=A0AAD6P1U1_9ROSI|nr:hypothetical protein OIU84_006384 [Salix udensis]
MKFFLLDHTMQGLMRSRKLIEAWFYNTTQMYVLHRLKEESTKRFVKLQKAYETLSDPISRRMHDYELGLVDSRGFEFEGLPLEDRKNRFPKEVWERQLHGLQQRSYARMEKRNNKYTQS